MFRGGSDTLTGLRVSTQIMETSKGTRDRRTSRRVSPGFMSPVHMNSQP
jgi:hypothetical protein